MEHNKIPIFPAFKPVEFSDKNLFEKYTSKFEPYADYTFNNYLSWDVIDANALSFLNDNLVLKFTDYVTGKPFLSFIGINRVTDTVVSLLNYVEEKEYEQKLKLVPEVSIKVLRELDGIDVCEDQTSHDYIFSISEIAQFNGRHYKSKRGAANKCSKLHNIKIVDDMKGETLYSEIVCLLDEWIKSKLQNDKVNNLNNEKMAIRRMLDISVHQENVLFTLAYSNDKIVGFSIDELLCDGFVLSHYFKTLPHYYGLTELLNQLVAERLQGLGYENWNWQQDLGIESLKKMKLGYRPKKFLKKFIIERTVADTHP